MNRQLNKHECSPVHFVQHYKTQKILWIKQLKMDDLAAAEELLLDQLLK